MKIVYDKYDFPIGLIYVVADEMGKNGDLVGFA